MSRAELHSLFAEQNLMGMPATVAPDWTVEMLDALPDSSERHEIIDGVLYVTPSPSEGHQLVVGALHVRIYSYLKGLGVGTVMMSPSDVRRGDRKRNRVQPDIYVVRLAANKRPPYPFSLSDLLLAVEIASPGNPALDYQVKRRLYLAEGVGEYWIADPMSRVLTRWRGRDDPGEAFTNRIEWQPFGMPSALVVDLQELFDEML